MRYIDEDNLPVEVKNNKIVKDSDKKYKLCYNYKIRSSGGFADAVLLGAIMITCLMWGLLFIAFVGR